MIKRIGILITALLAVMMMLSLSACGQQADEESYEGVLVNAQNNAIVVRGGSDVQRFFTTDQTEYLYEGGKDMCVGDELVVSYHREGSKSVASSILVREHASKTLTLEGEVTDLDDYSVTVNAKSSCMMTGSRSKEICRKVTG